MRQLVSEDKYIVAVDVEFVVPTVGPTEPCYEAKTVQYLHEVKEHADRSVLPWLKRHGKVYALIKAA